MKKHIILFFVLLAANAQAENKSSTRKIASNEIECSKEFNQIGLVVFKASVVDKENISSVEYLEANEQMYTATSMYIDSKHQPKIDKSYKFLVLAKGAKGLSHGDQDIMDYDFKIKSDFSSVIATTKWNDGPRAKYTLPCSKQK